VRRRISPLFISDAIAVMLIVFWNMMASYEGGEFEGWFNETELKFYAYYNGKGLNITYSKLVFTSPRTDNWFIILNNFGHMKYEAFPTKEVHIYGQILNTGFTEEQSFG